MRYRLRTLLLAATLGPPCLALAWFLLVWARYSISPLLLSLSQYFFHVGMLAVLVLAIYSIAAPPPINKPPVTLEPWQFALLWTCQLLAEWHWFWVVIGLGGWILLWGDRGPPVSEGVLLAIAGIVAAIGASLTSLRIVSGLASVDYVRTIVCFVAPLFSLASLFWIGRLLR